MALEQFSNAPILSTPSAAWTTLNGAILAGDTSLTVTSASTFPAVPQFRILIGDELLIVTALAGAVWTVTRGAESTIAAAHANGASVFHTLTAASLLRSPGALTTTGDLPYLASTGAPTRLAAGADGTYLRYVSGLPTASALLATDLTALPGSTTQVFFNDAGALGADAGLTYDKATHILGVALDAAIREVTGNRAVLTLSAGPSDRPNIGLGDLNSNSVYVNGFDHLEVGFDFGTRVPGGGVGLFGRNNSSTSNFSNGTLLFGGALTETATNQTWFGDTVNPVFLVGTPDITVESPLNFSGDTILSRGGGGAGQILLSAATTTNVFQVKNGSNAEVGAIGWSGNNFRVGTIGGTSGGTARDTILGSAAGATNGIYFATEDTSRWQVTPTGYLRPFVDATHDIGDASHQVRTLYAATVTTSSLVLASDVFVSRAAAATCQLGADVNGAAVNQTLWSCSGITGTDKTGSNFTIASGRGTGAGAVSSLLFQTPTVLGSGTTAQSLATRLTLDSAFATFAVPVKLSNAAVTGLVAGVLAAVTNASIVLYDSTGQAYRVPCTI